MFDPELFTSNFWEWFIISGTLGGILLCFLLILWMSGDRPKSQEEVKTMGHVWDENLEEFNNPLPRWWLWMFIITLIFGLIYLALYPGLGSFKGYLGWSEIGQYEKEMQEAKNAYDPLYAVFLDKPVEDLAKDNHAVAMGKRLFMTYCNVCHGSDARGSKGFPNLTDNDWLWGGEPQAIKTSIANGRQAVMPNGQANGLATDEDIENVAEYVLSLSGQTVDADKVAKGKTKFDGICMACHTPAGTGMAAVGAPNLTDDVWLYGSKKAELLETLKNGRQGVMPAHGDFLGEAKVHLLAAYVYSLSDKK